MSFKPDKNLLKALERDLAPRLENAALEGAAAVDENVSAGSRSGRKYPQLPRRSSSPKEFPQSQSGDLKASVDVQPGPDALTKQVGFFGDTQKKLNALEFGYPEGNLAPRKPLARTLETKDVQKAMLDAMKDGA